MCTGDNHFFVGVDQSHRLKYCCTNKFSFSPSTYVSKINTLFYLLTENIMFFFGIYTSIKACAIFASRHLTKKITSW